MRLPIVISVGLTMSFGLNASVMSQSALQVAQSPASANSNLGQLKIKRQQWNQQKIFNYRYTITSSCFCPPEARGPVVIEVRNGQTTKITSANTGQPVNPELFRKYNTIPKLFNLITNAITRRASSLTVQYNPTLGYPTQINIDYSSQMADEEVFLSIENLQKIQ
jgi:hypothetical protein